MRKGNEQELQHYLVKNNGEHLAEIEPSLILLDAEHKFPGGRIDIIAKSNDAPIGIELKAADYQTRAICAQLLNYLNYLSKFNGSVYFIAPKIKYGLYSTLQNFYSSGMLKFFEVKKNNENYSFNEIRPFEIDDKKHAEPVFEKHSTLEDKMFEEKMKKGIDILVRNRKKATLAKNIIDSKKEKRKYYEDVAESVIDMVEATTKSKGIGMIYRLMKLF
jgi:hypothetical protein